MLKISLFFLLVAQVIYWGIHCRSDRSIYFIVFLSSISAVIFREQGILISLSGLLTVAAALISPIRKPCIFPPRGLGKNKKMVFFSLATKGGIPPPKNSQKAQFQARPKHVSRSLGFCIFALVVLGFTTGLFNLGGNLSVYSSQSFQELLNVTIFPIVLYIFIRYANLTFVIEQKNIVVLRAFVSSVYFQALSIIFSVAGYQSVMPDFLVGSVVTVDETANYLTLVERYSGLLGDYELIVDYTLMVIAFSVVYMIRTKSYKISSSAIIASMFVAIYSGTRSFFVVLIIAILVMLVLSLFYLKRTYNKFSILSKISVVLITAMVFVSYFGRNFVVFERLSLAWDIFQSGAGLEVASNRSVSNTFLQLMDSVSVFGEGAFLFTDLAANEIVSHNVFFAVYCRYGLVGLSMLVYIIYISIYRLFKTLKAVDLDANRLEVITLLAFTFALVFQEMKISALRSMSSILIYAVWFLYIFSRVSNMTLRNQRRTSRLLGEPLTSHQIKRTFGSSARV